MEEQQTAVASPFAEGQQMQQVSAFEQKNQQIVQPSENIQQPGIMLNDQIPVEYAGFWARFAAIMVDGLVLFIPSVILSVILGKTFGQFSGTLLTWAYAVYMISTKQATLGKMAVGLKVTTSNGDKPSAGKAVVREILGKFVSAITLCIGYLMIAFTQKKQGLHDMIADTVVIWDPARKRRKWIIVLGIIFGLLVPVIMFISIIILAGTHSVREEMLESLSGQEDVLKNIQMQQE